MYVWHVPLPGDPGLDLKIYWLHNKNLLDENPPFIITRPDNTLVINTTFIPKKMVFDFVGDYTCVGDNGITKRAVTAKLTSSVSRVPKDVTQSSPAMKHVDPLLSEGEHTI